MKKLVFILLFIINARAFAQMEKTFTTRDSSDISRLINLVLKNAKNKYKLTNTNNSHENAIESVYSDGTRKLIFEFLRINSSANQSSNTPDSIHYTFISVTGPLKDLFPFWKKYYQPDAKMNATLKATHGKTIQRPYQVGEMISTFTKYGDNWEIETRSSQKK